MAVKKALTFRASSIGDCLMGAYLLNNIHAAYPDARLGIVVGSKAGMIRDVLAAYPWIEVVEANRRNLTSLFALWRAWHGADVVVLQYAGKKGGTFSLVSKLFGWLLARSGGLVGFADAAPGINKLLFSQTVQEVYGVAPAALERKALEAAGIPVAIQSPVLSYVPQPGAFERLSLTKGEYVVVHMFAGNNTRGISPETKHALIQKLETALPGVTLIIDGTKAERSEAQRAAEGTGARVIAGDTTLQEMLELIAGSNGVVSVDTGMAHITAQLQKPLAVLATCLGLHWWGIEQYGADAKVTLFTNPEAEGHMHQEYPKCINTVDLDKVAAAARAFA